MPWYQWHDLAPISFHSIYQAPKHPLQNSFPYPKWLNPWSIKTPRGYSTFFMQPVHRESVFTIMPGIVDTDKYTAPVNFPFVLNDANFEGLIPAGTPITQAIPFKRDKWKMTFGKEKDFFEQKNVTLSVINKYFDGYKTLYREKKEYD